MSKWNVHGKIKVTASLVATVCVPAKLGHVFAVGSLGYTQRSFGEVAKFPFGARTKLHKQILQLRFIMQHTVKRRLSGKVCSLIFCVGFYVCCSL